MRVPVEIVVDRVVDTLLVLAAIPQAEAGNAEVIEESSEIGPGAEGFDPQIGTLPQLLAIICFCIRDLRKMLTLLHGHPGFRIFDIACDSVDELLEAVRPSHLEESAIVSVGIDINCGVPAQLLGVRFNPFRGS